MSNTFVVNGDVIRRQIVGIPMGTNYAPLLANLYLYAHESRFIDRVIQTHGVQRARSFHMTFRLIDDVLSVDNALFEDCDDLYPSELTLEQTSISDSEVTFLGIHIVDNNDSLVLDVYNKKKAFPFKVICYPHLDTVIPTRLPYGVFTGLLWRRYRICNRISLFLKQAVDAANTLLENKCSKYRLGRLSRDFLCQRQPLKWSCPLSQLCRQLTRELGNSF